MTTGSKGITVQQLKQTLAPLLALIAAGLAGNYFRFPIFLNIDFLFGSIFAMLALQYFGPGRGILAAAIIASYTYVLWNHPYAIIIMTAEVAVVGWLLGRRKIGLVLADILYWLIIGMPLVYLFYHLSMQVSSGNTYIAMIKEAVNGIANALVARLIFAGFSLWSRSSLTSYREIISNLLAFFVLCPALIMLAAGSRTDFAATDHAIRTTLIQDSRRITNRVETWVMNRKSAILNLAGLAAARSPQQMQPYLEQAKKSDINFLRIGLLDREATTVALFPLIDELGQKNIGRNYADRPFIPQLKQTRKPMLSEVVMSRIGTPRPTVSMLAPVVIGGEYSGYVIGILNLDQIREHLDSSTDEYPMLFTLLDRNGNVIMTNHTDQAVMKPLVRGKGTLNRLDNAISQWVPALPHNTPVSERWKNSFYVAESAVGDLAEWKLILEQPVAPFQKKLYDQYTGKLALLFLILLAALALAELMSRKIIVTLEKLRTLTHDLPVRLETGGREIAWPQSGIKEVNHLINNFREMSNTLTEQFNEVRQLVEKMRESRQQLLDIIDFFPDATFVVDNEKRVIAWNRAMEIMSGVSKAEMLGQGDRAYTIPFYGERRHNLIDLLDESTVDLAAKYQDVSRENNILCGEAFCPALYGGRGAYVWATVAPLFDARGVRVGAIESIRDTTERRQAQDALKLAYTEMEIRVRQRTAELQAANTALTAEIIERKSAEEQLQRSLREKDVLLKEIHHRVKNNMQVIYSLLNLQAKGMDDKAVRAKFEESRDRVNSMALIHEKLYRSADLAHIDFKEYLKSLVRGIADTHKRHGVAISVDMDPVALDVNVGIPCGLIVNELVSNSLKHAFPDGRTGTIAVGIRINSGGDNVLFVEDNGIGFPADLDFRNTSSLGLQLVNGLTGQINGSIRLSRQTGTGLSITFPGTSNIRGGQDG